MPDPYDDFYRRMQRFPGWVNQWVPPPSFMAAPTNPNQPSHRPASPFEPDPDYYRRFAAPNPNMPLRFGSPEELPDVAGTLGRFFDAAQSGATAPIRHWYDYMGGIGSLIGESPLLTDLLLGGTQFMGRPGPWAETPTTQTLPPTYDINNVLTPTGQALGRFYSNIAMPGQHGSAGTRLGGVLGSGYAEPFDLGPPAGTPLSFAADVAGYGPMAVQGIRGLGRAGRGLAGFLGEENLARLGLPELLAGERGSLPLPMAMERQLVAGREMPGGPGLRVPIPTTQETAAAEAMAALRASLRERPPGIPPGQVPPGPPPWFRQPVPPGEPLPGQVPPGIPPGQVPPGPPPQAPGTIGTGGMPPAGFWANLFGGGLRPGLPWSEGSMLGARNYLGRHGYQTASLAGLGSYLAYDPVSNLVSNLQGLPQGITSATMQGMPPSNAVPPGTSGAPPAGMIQSLIAGPAGTPPYAQYQWPPGWPPSGVAQRIGETAVPPNIAYGPPNSLANIVNGPQRNGLASIFNGLPPTIRLSTGIPGQGEIFTREVPNPMISAAAHLQGIRESGMAELERERIRQQGLADVERSRESSERWRTQAMWQAVAQNRMPAATAELVTRYPNLAGDSLTLNENARTAGANIDTFAQSIPPRYFARQDDESQDVFQKRQTVLKQIMEYYFGQYMNDYFNPRFGGIFSSATANQRRQQLRTLLRPGG